MTDREGIGMTVCSLLGVIVVKEMVIVELSHSSKSWDHTRRDQ